MTQTELAGYVTLEQLAQLVHCTPDSLRQRIARGTLRAEKAGTVWLVAPAERKRIVDAYTQRMGRRAERMLESQAKAAEQAANAKREAKRRRQREWARAKRARVKANG